MGNRIPGTAYVHTMPEVNLSRNIFHSTCGWISSMCFHTKCIAFGHVRDSQQKHGLHDDSNGWGYLARKKWKNYKRNKKKRKEIAVTDSERAWWKTSQSINTKPANYYGKVEKKMQKLNLEENEEAKRGRKWHAVLCRPDGWLTATRTTLKIRSFPSSALTVTLSLTLKLTDILLLKAKREH